MNDKETVIKGLEICYSYSPLSKCDGCPYHNLPDEQSCNDVLCLDALALLKEQEAVEPYSINAERTYGLCPKCGKLVFRYGNVEENHYCGVCGQAVKWE